MRNKKELLKHIFCFVVYLIIYFLSSLLSFYLMNLFLKSLNLQQCMKVYTVTIFVIITIFILQNYINTNSHHLTFKEHLKYSFGLLCEIGVCTFDCQIYVAYLSSLAVGTIIIIIKFFVF